MSCSARVQTLNMSDQQIAAFLLNVQIVSHFSADILCMHNAMHNCKKEKRCFEKEKEPHFFPNPASGG